MEKFISSKSVLRRHLQLMFNFQSWKVQEQLSYVRESDLELFELYHPVLHTKSLIVTHQQFIATIY